MTANPNAVPFPVDRESQLLSLGLEAREVLAEIAPGVSFNYWTFNGDEKSFRFRAINPGLYIYHCAVPNMSERMSHGMYGLILVEPEGGLPEVDQEFYVVQGELFTAGTIGRPGLQVFDGGCMLE
ncbi:MAG: hypothetical protein M0R02_12775 [Bacteroidales bacterium]|nr:hypothetical protein [Bacteroidales bacterium]